MSALMIVQARVLARQPYREYQKAVQPLIAAHGGRLRARGVDLEVLEGGHDGRRLLVFEFASMGALRGFWHSPEYAAVRALREGAAQVDVWALPAS